MHSPSRFFVGDDIFISYARADAATYAAALAGALTKRGLSCRFDQWGAAPGAQVPSEILRALRRSGLLVVVGTTGAGQSEHVSREIDEFLPTKRFIVPIEVDGTLRQATWWPRLNGLAISQEGNADAIPTKPSDLVVERIVSSITFATLRRRMRRTLAALGAAAVALAATAALFGGLARANQREAARQAELAAIRSTANQATVSLGQGALVQSLSLALGAAGRAEHLGEPVLEADTALRRAVALLPRSHGALASCTLPKRIQVDSTKVGSGTFVRIRHETPARSFDIALDHRAGLTSSRLSPDGRYFVLGLVDHSSHERMEGGEIYAGYLELWDLHARRRIVRWMPNGFMEVRSVAFSENGNHLAAGGLGLGPRIGIAGRVLVWAKQGVTWSKTDFESAAELRQDEAIRSIAVSNGGRFLVTNAFKDAFVWRMSLGRFEQFGRIPALGEFDEVGLDNEGRHVITRETGKSAKCEGWDLTGYRETAMAYEPELAGLGLSAGAASATNPKFRLTDDSERLRIVESSSGQDVTPEQIKALEHVRRSTFSVDGRYVAILDQEGIDEDENPQELVVWDLSRGRRVISIAVKDSGFIRAYEFSPDSTVLAVGDTSGSVRVVTLKDGALRSVQQFTPVTTIAFRADGRALAAGDSSGFVNTWQMPGLQGVARLPHNGEVREIRMSADGERIAVRTSLTNAGFADRGDDHDSRHLYVSTLSLRSLIAESCTRLGRFSNGRTLPSCSGRERKWPPDLHQTVP